jgi:tRNA(fMet)-specific endonuclease VapC
MTRFVLDTDTVSLLQHGNSTIAKEVAKHAPDEVATTIITVEEQLSGWYTLLRRAKTSKKLVPIYDQMSETLRFLARLPILTFTEAAADVYEQLRHQKPRRGRMDLRIAAIAISNNATLVTRNLSDFEDIESLTVVDWSRARSPHRGDAGRAEAGHERGEV